MLRCVLLSALLALPLVAPAQQFQRNFPADALRGELSFLQPPAVLLNGREARLAPGARIRGENNLLQMSGALMGYKSIVHYTVDDVGLIKDVWVLNAGELANKPWPTTPKEAATWGFDPIGQRWVKP